MELNKLINIEKEVKENIFYNKVSFDLILVCIKARVSNL